MHTLFTPDNRLALCASFVRDKVKVADIGTDHAYLPVWLCLTGKAVSAVAADINPEPLSRGELTIKKYGAEKLVKTRLSGRYNNCRHGRRAYSQNYGQLPFFKKSGKKIYFTAYD